MEKEILLSPLALKLGVASCPLNEHRSYRQVLLTLTVFMPNIISVCKIDTI